MTIRKYGAMLRSESGELELACGARLLTYRGALGNGSRQQS